MIYRIDQDALSPYIDLDSEIKYDIDLDEETEDKIIWPFFLTTDIHSYIEVWDTPNITFLQWNPKADTAPETHEIPDLAVSGGKLFLNEKAYCTFNDVFKGHGEFLPVTFKGGAGYIFNPLVGIEPVKGSIVRDIYDPRLVESFKFDESIINAPIFKGVIKKRKHDIFITKDIYHMIRLNGLKGLSFYKDYSDTYAEPEGGYNYSTSMPGYENED